jgi:hypothetical protein
MKLKKFVQALLSYRHDLTIIDNDRITIHTFAKIIHPKNIFRHILSTIRSRQILMIINPIETFAHRTNSV